MGRHVSLPGTESPASNVPPWLRIAGLTLRAVFIISLVVLTFRVSLPQNETMETAYDTPNDLIRMALGFAVCAWLVVQLVRMPHDAAGYRSWLYIGLAGVPFALICLFYAW
jgi:TRAP-type C4-dicarboxylate transport system permease small subunit